MGVRQSSPVSESRTRAYSSPVEPSGSSSTPGFRYTASPGGPRIRYTGGTQPSSYHQTGMSIPHGGRGSSLDQEETDGERGGEHQMMIRSTTSPVPSPTGSKFVASDVMEIHLIMCLTESRLRYNGV
uniref:E3 ubiquitin-protein ligase znrf2-like isoform X2 n=1 Tax=Oncorhynchus gorbuscha TaxID=8017 RepID=UPI001EAED932|nr:E3 ubiquitin-protein ligase znrf2-like isoform X2 [Oncorhynchus gorbuscha]